MSSEDYYNKVDNTCNTQFSKQKRPLSANEQFYSKVFGKNLATIDEIEMSNQNEENANNYKTEFLKKRKCCSSRIKVFHLMFVLLVLITIFLGFLDYCVWTIMNIVIKNNNRIDYNDNQSKKFWISYLQS